MVEQTLITAASSGSEGHGLLPEHQRVYQLCKHTQSVAEISEKLDIPLGVVQIIVADLAASGLVSLLGGESLRHLDRTTSAATTPTRRAHRDCYGLGLPHSPVPGSRAVPLR
ncbi:DUF742 domain-containing protein [Streptomyces sp. NPDC020096]